MGISLRVALLFMVLCAANRPLTHAQRVLESYNVDVDRVSVSGASAGAGMAVQMHVAYSSVFMGVGAFAGGAYYCAEGSVAQAGLCMLDAGIDPFHLSIETRYFANDGKIDAVTNMFHSRVFLLHGEQDSLVDPGASETGRDYYLEFMPPENIKLVRIPNLIHGFPTEDYGADCNRLSPSTYYINRCEYHGAFEMLNWIYQDLEFYEYDQEEFREGLGSMAGISMASRGFIYVPTGCVDREKACRLHVSLHGCNSGIDDIEDGFVSNSFYHQVAELNDIIILWPQATASLASPVNPQGCWDWWGYNDGITETGNYATQLGDQTDAIINMVQRVIGDSVKES